MVQKRPREDGRAALMPGRVVRWVALTLVLARFAGATDWAGEVSVLSEPGAATAVILRARPEVVIEDRTPGARPAAGPRGPASAGETFTGEMTILLRDLRIGRAASIEVGDPVVSAVRMFPDEGGTLITVFVRQPVTYTVSRPSGIGEIRIELRTKTRPLTVTPGRQPFRPRITAPAPTGEREVAVDAESLSYDQATNVLTARGGVTLTRGDTTLTADEVVYDRTNGIAEARGHVVLRDPQATVEGHFAHLNLEDESGWIEAADATFHPSTYFLTAGRLEKQGGPRYSVADGVFTTCECGGLEKPSWSLGGRQTDVTLEGTGVTRGATFRVKDVPVAWFPYLLFPANTQRQTGFLIPRVGYSNRRGFQYEQPFYWAINKSMDATFATDVETAARVGVIGEYRYALSRRARGAFTAAYYNQHIGGAGSEGTLAPDGLPADPPENRFGIAGHHISPAWGGSKFYLDMLAVSDDTFLRDMNTFAFGGRNDVGLRTMRFTTSRSGLVKSWPAGFAWGEVAYYQDLVDSQDVALQKLPQLQAEHSIPLLGDRVVARLNGQAIDYQREEGFDGLRGDFIPDLFFPFHFGRALNGSLTGRFLETVYHLTDREQVALVVPDASTGLQPFFRPAPGFPLLNTNRSRELAEVHGRTGTEFARVFDFPHFGLEKLKHTIEPEVQYLYVPKTGRPSDELRATIDCGQIPGGVAGRSCPVTLFTEGYLFDERDAINRRNFFSYGFTTRLLARGAAPEATPEPAEGTPSEPAAPRDDEGPLPQAMDTELLPQGLSFNAVPPFVGPPVPPAGGRPAAPAPRELARATILHGYDVSRTLVDDTHHSDIDLGLRVTPADFLGMTYNTTFSATEAALRGMSVGLVMREPWWRPNDKARTFQSPSSIGVSYRFIEQSVNTQAATGRTVEQLALASPGVNEVDGSVYLRLGDYLGFAFLARYDLNSTVLPTGPIGPHFLERDYLVRLISRCNCWVMEAGVADKFNPDERSFRVQFTLVGLGSLGKSPANRNYVGFAPLTNLGYRRPGVGPAGPD